MIPSQSGIHRPRTATNLILDEERLLAIVAPVGESEIQRDVLVEIILVRDRVGEVLAHGSKIEICAGFPFVHTAMRRDRAVQIELTKATIL